MDSMDPLDRLARELKDIELRATEQARPIRDRMNRLGAAGLYALAAAEQREADIARDEAGRSVHLAGAMAAQALADLHSSGAGRAR